MIPLSYFLLAWLILLGIYAILSFFSIVQMLRFAVSGFMTYVSTVIFLFVVFGILGITGLYLIHVDWTQSLDLTELLQMTPFTR